MAAIVTITSNWEKLSQDRQVHLKTLYARILAKAILSGGNSSSTTPKESKA